MAGVRKTAPVLPGSPSGAVLHRTKASLVKIIGFAKIFLPPTLGEVGCCLQLIKLTAAKQERVIGYTKTPKTGERCLKTSFYTLSPAVAGALP